MSDPLLNYDSFHDPHLQEYFQKSNVKKHLRKIGLINRYGQMISSKEYQIAMNERSRQEHARTLLSHGVVQRVIQLEKVRQANLRNQFEANAKRIRVQNIKEYREQSKEYRSKDLAFFNRPKSSIYSNENNPYHQQIKIIAEYNQTPSRLSSLHPSRSSSRRTEHRTPKIKKSNLNEKDRCQLTIIYLGRQSNQSFIQINSSEIVVMQQHCGGENILLFKNNLQINEKFRIDSHRHKEYPFALTFYVNGLIDCRISVCCEYKHQLGLPIGGIKSSFAILNVQGGNKCHTCLFNEYITNSPLTKSKYSDQNSILTNPSKSERSDSSNIHRLLSTPTQDDPIDTLVSHENDQMNEAKEIYENLLKKVNEKSDWKEIGYLEMGLGNVCKEGLGDYDKALEHYLLSLEIFCQNLSPFDLKLRNLYLNIGHILLLQGIEQNHLSIQYFQRITQIDQQFSQLNDKYLINDHYYLGLLYQNEQDFHQSLIHFNQSLQYYHQINENKSHQSFNSYFPSETIYDKKALESLSIDKYPNLSEIYFNLSTTYQNLGEKENAFKYAEKAHQLNNDDQNQSEIYRNYFNKLQHT